MTGAEVGNALVRSLVLAVNTQDRAAFLAALSIDATLADDGVEQELHEWIDREIFASNGQMQVQSVTDAGMTLVARFRNDSHGEMLTRWRFEVNDDGKITRIVTGQA